MVEVVNLLFNDATEGPEFESRSGLLMIVLKKYVLFKLFLTCKIINEVTRNFKSIIQFQLINHTYLHGPLFKIFNKKLDIRNTARVATTAHIIKYAVPSL